MTFDPTMLQFLRPQWLWALLALPALALLWRARRRHRSAWRASVDAHLLPHLLDARAGVRGAGLLWTGLLAAALAILALAGPSWRASQQPLWQARAPLVVVLDLSGAALAADLPPSRLLQARAKIAALLRARAGGQVGLVAYADDAFTVSPLTDDADNVALFLDALSPDIMPVDGSRAQRGIEEAAKLMRQAGFEHGDILLLSDHADAAARDAAALAQRAGYRVSALGLGTARGAAYRGSDGGIAQARLDAGSLRALATAGGGAYAALGTGEGDLRTLGVLEARRAQGAMTQDGSGGLRLDEGYWLLPPVLLLALFAFRRGAIAVLLVCAWFPLSPARAADGTLWRRADQVDHQRMQAGERAYRKDDFAGAQRAWDGLPGAEAAYNRGNALARAGDYDAAIAAYDDALRQRPGMEDAIANRKAVEAAMKRKPPPGKNDRPQDKKTPQGQQDPKPDGPPPPDPEQGKDPQSADAQRQQADQSRADQADPQPDGDPSQSQNADGQAQRDANALQRARMQRALTKEGREAEDGVNVQGDPERPETDAERERRIANEAWLRRIPDDPGGLLRAKFRLEHERRQKNGTR